MTINEKLNYISECEEVGLHEQVIRDLIYDEEHPEERIRFNTVEELIEYLETEEEEESEDEIECDEKGLPLIYAKRI